ncbi:MAG: hypothetical protein R3E39_05570 [Anaerolineae bacterium]
MGQVNIQDILHQLAPRPFPDLIYDIFLYVMFFLNLGLMFMQSDKENITTIMAGGAAALCVIAKLNVFPPRNFGSLIVNAGILILPLLVFGISRTKKSRPLGIISGVLGGVYFFLYWFISQRGPG